MSEPKKEVDMSNFLAVIICLSAVFLGYGLAKLYGKILGMIL